MGRNMSRVKSCFLILAFSLCASSAINGQVVTYEGCIDARGVPVASILDNSIGDIAIASLMPNGVPVIRYSQFRLNWLSPQTRLWAYGHECGHHALGHTIGTTHASQVEQAADCYGIRKLVGAGLLEDSDITAIQQDLARMGPGDSTHLSGRVRAVNLRLCLQGNDSSTPSRSAPVCRTVAVPEQYTEYQVVMQNTQIPCQHYFCNYGVCRYAHIADIVSMPTQVPIQRTRMVPRRVCD